MQPSSPGPGPGPGLRPTSGAGGKTDPLIDSVLYGTYRIDRLLGRGGMGSVYAATHVHLQTPCAIKVLLHEFSESDSSESLKRFQREAQITSQLGHPNIVRVTDFNFTPDGSPFMVMELLSGMTLQRRLKNHGPLSLAETVLLFGPLCDALGLAHARGVVHRDLKPENIFLPEEVDLSGSKILDFGISKIRDGNTRLTQADVQMGTQSYMAPEIVCGAAAEADIRSDVFSLGAILYETLTGKMAYDGPNAMAVMYKLMYQPPPKARDLRPDLPEPVEAVILKALAREPGDRVQSAPDLFAELTAAALPFLPVATEEQSTPYRYTSTTMKALRASGAFSTVPRTVSDPGLQIIGRPATGPAQTTPRPTTGPRSMLDSLSDGAPGAGQQTFMGQKKTPPAPFRAEPPGLPGPGPGPGIDDGQAGPSSIADSPLGETYLEDERENRKKKSGGPLVMGVIAALVVITGVGFLILRSRMTDKPAAIAEPVKQVPDRGPAPIAAVGNSAAQQPAANAGKAAADSKDKKGEAGKDEPAKGDGDEADGKKHHRRHHERELPRLNLPTLPSE